MKAQIELLRDTVVDERALNFPEADYNTFGAYPNQYAYIQEAILTYNGYQYCAYYNSSFQVCVARRPKDVSAWQILVTNETLRQERHDTHNNVSIGISTGDGRLHMAWDHHNESSLYYCKSVPGIATNPETAQWDASIFDQKHDPMQSSTDKMTYPRFIGMPNGGLLLEHRNAFTGIGSKNGDPVLHRYDPVTSTWTTLGRYTQTPNGTYVNMLRYAPDGRLHVSWVERVQGLDDTQGHYYLYSDDDGTSWCNNEGENVASSGSHPLVDISQARIFDTEGY